MFIPALGGTVPGVRSATGPRGRGRRRVDDPGGRVQGLPVRVVHKPRADGGLFGSSVANGGVGYCCIAELRMYETIEQGTPKTSYMRFGDRVRIEMRDNNGASIFGAIEQTVERYAAG